MTTEQRQRIEKVVGKDFDVTDIPPTWREGKTVNQLNAELGAERDNAKLDQMEERDYYDGIVREEQPEEDDQE